MAPCAPFLSATLGKTHGDLGVTAAFMLLAWGTLNAMAKQTALGRIMATDGGDCEDVLGDFADAGVDVEALAARLQDEGAKSFVAS